MNKFRRSIALIMVVTLLLSIALPALAWAKPKNPNPKANRWSTESTETTPAKIREKVKNEVNERMKSERFVLLGTVTAVTAEGSSFRVLVKRGAGAAKGYRGSEVTIFVNDETRFVRVTGIEGLKVRGRVHVKGNIVEDKMVATRVKFTPLKFVINGEVAGIGEGSFDVKVTTTTKSAKNYRGRIATILYNDKTKFVSNDSTVTAGALVVGAKVNVAGYFDGDTLWARRVTIK